MARVFNNCTSGIHDHCRGPEYCFCWCHKIERVSKVSATIKTYRVELHTLTETRAEFREVQEKAERGSGIIWGSTTGHTTFTVSDPSFAPTHTWAMPRTEWEELGRPLSFNLKVEVQ